MTTNSPLDPRAVAQQWHSWATAQLATRPAHARDVVSNIDLATRAQEALARGRQLTGPPTMGLHPRWVAWIMNWTEECVRELRTAVSTAGDEWHAALQHLRARLTIGELSQVREDLLNVIANHSQRAGQAYLQTQGRYVPDQQANPAPETEQPALLKLISWLESLPERLS